MNAFINNELPHVTASAPGRLDVMGGIADYSGSLLLQMPIKQRTTVTIQKTNESRMVIRTGSNQKYREFSIDTGTLQQMPPEDRAAFIRKQPEGSWAIYVIGSVLVLHLHKKIPLEGLHVWITSAVPEGKGVSSSAALEVAVMKALQQLYQLSLSETELPLLAQKAENLMVGAPCGLMDQLSTYLGQKNRLLPLQCQPHTVYPSLPIPAGIQFTAIDSGIRHAVSGASYGDVRTAAFMSYSIIALQAGAGPDDLLKARNTGDFSALPYNGFLANIPLSVFKEQYQSLLPESMQGSDFLHHYKHSIDKVTHIDAGRIYHLRACGSHPVEENFRIGLFQQLLMAYRKTSEKQAILKQLGELMLQSHAGYNAIGLGNDHTNHLVEKVREAGAGNGVYGARITGGGSGGAVCILCEGARGVQTARQIWKNYMAQFKKRTLFFQGSSSGAFYS